MEVWLLYKFDPMDFETKILKLNKLIQILYKFDPMDFETFRY